MANSGLVIPDELNRIVSERVTLWRKFDESQNQIREIEKLASQVAASAPAEIPSEMTGAKTPPAEVEAALNSLQAQLEEISKAQASIKAYEDEIQRLKTERQKVIAISAVVIVIIILFVLYLAQSSF